MFNLHSVKRYNGFSSVCLLLLMLEKKFIPNKKFIKQINSAIITKMSDKIIQSYRAYGTGKHGKVLLA